MLPSETEAASIRFSFLHPRSILPFGAIRGGHLAKPNYQFEKRQRDLAKKRKQEEKRVQKLAAKAAADNGGGVADAEADTESAESSTPPLA